MITGKLDKMDRVVEIATTYNKGYYDLVGKLMIESFVKWWPKDCKLHVYWQEQEPEIIQDNIMYYELYKVQPQLKEWIDAHQDPVYHGWQKSTNSYTWKNNGVKFSHKVFAQTHRIKNSTADVILYSDADTLYHAPPNLDYLREICPADSLCTFFDRPRFRDETGFYMHNPKHPKAKDWANRMEEIYLKDELWGWPDQQADQYTMARGRDSFMSCKQMDLMQYHRNLGLNNKDPVPYSPLKKFMNHLKGQKKLQGKTADDPSVFPSVKIRKEQK